jgi:trimeric autotransporter adhesin
MNAPRCAALGLVWLTLVGLTPGCGRDPLDGAGTLAGRGGTVTGGVGGGGEEGGAGGAGGRDGGAPMGRTDAGTDRREGAPDFRPGEVSIQIVPGDGPPLPAGQSIQLRALIDLGGLRDITLDAELVWRVDDPAVAQVAERSGRLTAVAAGTTTVHASHPALGRGSAPVQVTSAAVRTLMVAPGQVQLTVGQSEQLHARALYGDGTEADVTAAARWLSSDQRIVRVGTGLEPVGLVTSVRTGETMVTAEFAGARAQSAVLVSGGEGTVLSVTPMTGRGMAGATVTFQAFARRGGAAVDVTNQAGWASSAAAATSLGNGRFRCNVAGAITVTATYFGMNATAALECGGGAMEIEELRLTSANSDFFVGLTYRLSAQAFFTDGSPPRELMNNQLRWMSSDSAVATVDGGGILTARAPGTVVISASFGTVTGQETYTIKMR